jgi:hypothetical protein
MRAHELSQIGVLSRREGHTADPDTASAQAQDKRPPKRGADEVDVEVAVAVDVTVEVEVAVAVPVDLPTGLLRPSPVMCNSFDLVSPAVVLPMLVSKRTRRILLVVASPRGAVDAR